MNEEDLYNCDILGIPVKNMTEDERIKRSVIWGCRRMDKADVYEWCANDEIKIKQLQQENQQLKEQIQHKEELLEKIKENIKENAFEVYTKEYGTIEVIETNFILETTIRRNK